MASLSLLELISDLMPSGRQSRPHVLETEESFRVSAAALPPTHTHTHLLLSHVCTLTQPNKLDVRSNMHSKASGALNLCAVC